MLNTVLEPIQIDKKISDVKFKLRSAKSSGNEPLVQQLSKELADLKQRLDRGETYDVPF